MGRNARQRPSEPGRPLSMRAIVMGGVLVGVVGAVAVAALLYFYGGGTDHDRAGLDLVRTAGTLVVGTGGVIALLLAARRQRSTELTLEHQWLTLEHQREVAATAARDAVEQRITELYTRAVDQLGNDQAPVRLGGLHALERLAQNNPVQQQTIVDVICAYLRMPYGLPDDKPPGEDAPAEARTRYEQRRQELQVRLTAQRIMAAHLRADAVGTFWRDIDLDLTEAQLHKLDLANCCIRNAQFSGAQFSGNAGFDEVKFSGDAWFDRVQFSGDVGFDQVQFSGHANFGKAHFMGNAGFEQAQFSPKGADFHQVQFSGFAGFDQAKFLGYADFSNAQFSGDANFSKVQFFARARFWYARFSRDAGFELAQFSPRAEFHYARFSKVAFFEQAQAYGCVSFDYARARQGNSHYWPATWTTGEAGKGDEDGWLYVVRVEK